MRDLKLYVMHCFANGCGTATTGILPHLASSPKQTLPFLDKVSGFYSAPITQLRKITEKNVLLEVMCELILPLGWATTFANIYPLLRGWAKEGLPPSNNYAITIIDLLRDRHGSFLAGDGPCYQPSFNFLVFAKDIDMGLRSFVTVITDINAGNLELDDYNLCKRLSGIIGIGDLGSLHLLHLATMCGLIHNTDFIAHAHVNKGTTTWKIVVSVFQL